MDGIERSSCQEVEGAEDTQVDPMMLERLVGEVSDIEPDRVRPELQEQPAHPGLKLRGLSARDWRPAGARPTADVGRPAPQGRGQGALGPRLFGRVQPTPRERQSSPDLRRRRGSTTTVVTL